MCTGDNDGDSGFVTGENGRTVVCVKLNGSMNIRCTLKRSNWEKRDYNYCRLSIVGEARDLSMNE